MSESISDDSILSSEEEQEFEDFASKNTSNILNAINLNELVQNKIHECLFNVERKMESLNDSIEYLVCQSKQEDDLRGSYVSQYMNGMRLRVLRKPYFTSKLGMTPPTNNIAKLRRESCNYDYYEIKHELYNICCEKDKQRLTAGICGFIFSNEIRQYKLGRPDDRFLSREIKKLGSMSLTDLSRKFTDDMMDKICWLKISTHDMRGRFNPEGCKRLWQQLVSPQLANDDKWSDEECTELLKLIEEFGCKGHWVQIAEKMPLTRAPFKYYRKWLQLTNKLETDNEWSSSEDDVLQNAIKHCECFGKEQYMINWYNIAAAVPSRSPKDCERRWALLQSTVLSMPFTMDEDMELLLLIKKIGTENWFEIGRNMKRKRHGPMCETRYCEIVDDLQPWRYIEDRKIWLYLRPYLRSHWIDGEQVESFTRSLDLFKKVLPILHNRAPVAIRHRYLKLLKWFNIWNQFYIVLCRKENPVSVSEASNLLSEDFSQNNAVMNKLKKILQENSYVELIVNILRQNGSSDPETEAEKLIKDYNRDQMREMIRNGEGVQEQLFFLKDINMGQFVPRPFNRFLRRGSIYLRPDRAPNDLRLITHNINKMESSNILKKTISNEIECLLKQQKLNDRLTEEIRSLNKLHEDSALFNASFTFAVNTLEKTHDFQINCMANTFKKQIMPRFLNLMIQFIYEKERRSSKSFTVLFTNQLASWREKIADLLIFRESYQQIYKTYPKNKQSCLLTKLLGTPFTKSLLKPEIQADSVRKTGRYYMKQLGTSSTVANNGQADLASMKLLPPNRTNLMLLRAFYLQSSQLLKQGEDEFVRMNRIKYDHPGDALQKEGPSSRSQIKLPVSVDRLEPDRKQSELCDPRYELLRSRLLGTLATPALLSNLSISTCHEIADRLHETQNLVSGSSFISKSLSKFDVKQVKKKGQSRTPAKRFVAYLDSDSDSLIGSPAPKRQRTESEAGDGDGSSSNEMDLDCCLPLPLRFPEHAIIPRMTRRQSRFWAKLQLPGGRTLFMSRAVLAQIHPSDLVTDPHSD